LNWCTRFCRPLRNHSATWPHKARSIYSIKYLGNRRPHLLRLLILKSKTAFILKWTTHFVLPDRFAPCVVTTENPAKGGRPIVGDAAAGLTGASSSNISRSSCKMEWKAEGPTTWLWRSSRGPEPAALSPLLIRMMPIHQGRGFARSAEAVAEPGARGIGVELACRRGIFREWRQLSGAIAAPSTNALKKSSWYRTRVTRSARSAGLR
jgi:hypothetical protein